MADFGTDLSAFPDLSWTLKSGLDNLAEAAVRCLTTAPGALFYAPEYRLDLRRFLNESVTAETLFEIETLASNALEADPRILEAQVTARQPERNLLELDIALDTAQGPFELVLRISQVSVEVLRA
jgi:phage baseplate assembly protein W